MKKKYCINIGVEDEIFDFRLSDQANNTEIISSTDSHTISEYCKHHEIDPNDITFSGIKYLKKLFMENKRL